MATELFSEDINITLGAGISTTPAAGTVETNWSFTFPNPSNLTAPSATVGQYRMQVNSEIVIWTAGPAVPTTGGTTTGNTVTRGAENSLIAAHGPNTACTIVATAGNLSNAVQLSPSAAQTGTVNVTGGYQVNGTTIGDIATTTTPGSTLIDAPPASGNPVALTEAGTALPVGMLGTTATTAAAGNDSRITNSVQLSPAAAQTGNVNITGSFEVNGTVVSGLATTTTPGLTEVDAIPLTGSPIALTRAGTSLPAGMLGTTATTAAAGNDGRITNSVQLNPGSAQSGSINVSGTITGNVVADGNGIYDVRNYGAKFDVKTVTDAAMAASVATLTSATANFTAADVNKLIQVISGATQVGTGTITAFTNSTTVTVSFTNGTTAYTGASATYGTDDRVAIQTTLDQVQNGGRVLLPAGTCFVSTAGHPDNAGYVCGFYIYTGTLFMGVSEKATTIMLAPMQPTGCYGMLNRFIAAGGDTDITLQDFTYDGNTGGQGTVANIPAQDGIFMMRTARLNVMRVTSKDCRGTSNTGTGESFSFETQLGLDSTFINCTSIGTQANASACFSADGQTGTRYIGCTAAGSSFAQGFTHNNCTNMSYTNCFAYNNGNAGFNSEVSRFVSYVGCIAGTQSSASTGGTYPYAANTSLANTNYDFVLNTATDALISGCTSSNSANGIRIISTSRGVVTGCNVNGHSSVGIAFADNASAIACKLSNNMVVNNAVNLQTFVNGGAVNINMNGPAQLTVNVPASGTALQNPFGVDCFVILSGGTVSQIQVDSYNIGITSGSYAVPATSTTTVYYSAVPTWVWVLL